MKMLSMQRPLPSMLIVTSCRFSTPVKSSLVNWPSGTAQPDLPLAEVYGPAVILTDHREVPLSEEGWSSTPTRPQTLAQLIRATRCLGVPLIQRSIGVEQVTSLGVRAN